MTKISYRDSEHAQVKAALEDTALYQAIVEHRRKFYQHFSQLDIPPESVADYLPKYPLVDKITPKEASYPTKLLIRAFHEIIIVKNFIFENAILQSLRRIQYEHQHVVQLSLTTSHNMHIFALTITILLVTTELMTK